MRRIIAALAGVALLASSVPAYAGGIVIGSLRLPQPTTEIGQLCPDDR